MSYESKLLAMKKKLKKTSPVKEAKKKKKPSPPFYAKKWDEAGLKQHENDFGTYFVREVRYPFSYEHGKYALASFFKAKDAWTEGEHPIQIEPHRRVVFYDTETTGLKGTGTYIFLNGLLTIEEDAFVLKQYVLADPTHEAAFLAASNLWKPHQTIITYNGKSFDWPQLQMRWTFHREEIPPLPTHQQIDLMHSAKRIWKKQLETMKLSQIERSKLDFHRQGDVPGYLAPAIYLNAVKTGEVDHLLEILTHNEYDLLSLVTLYIEATRLLTQGIEEETAKTYTNIGKWYKDLNVSQMSIELLEDVTNTYSTREAAEAHFYKAFLHKKNKRYEEAYQSFVAALIAVTTRQKIEALIELAKLCEHQFRQLEDAKKWAQLANEEIRKSTIYTEDVKEKRLRQIAHRIQRIEAKIERSVL